MFKPFKGLGSGQIKKIQSVYPKLKQIQEITGVPWQAMAAIWFRESFSVASPKTPGGPWQFDPIPDDGTLRKLLDRYTNLSDSEKQKVVNAGVDDFLNGGILSACFLRNKVSSHIHPKVDDSVIKEALYGYNGRKYGRADNSPYVMNGYDEDHYPMRLRGTIPDGKGGRKWVEINDERPGAYTVYKQLKELFP